MLVAEDIAVSEFLGDAEEPHHTKWNERREGFGEKYNQHITTLRFIRNAMNEIVKILDIQTEERDYDLLKNDDFQHYFEERKEALLQRIENATQKRIVRETPDETAQALEEEGDIGIEEEEEVA